MNFIKGNHRQSTSKTGGKNLSLGMQVSVFDLI